MGSKKKRKHETLVQKEESLVSTTSLTHIKVLAACLFLFAFALYAPTIGFDFALDDYSVILENHVTKNGIDAIPTIFKTTYRFGYPIQGDELYRPIPKSIFAILWSVAGNNPVPYHLLNVLLYALTAFFLFTALCRFLPNHVYLPFAATALFIAHPIHTEVVSNIKSLDEILSFLLFVISLHTLHYYLNKKGSRWLWFTLVLFFLALLTKESSITYLAVYPLIIYFFSYQSTGSIISITAMLLIPVAIFLIIRSSIVGDYVLPSMADNAILSTTDFIERKATAIFILGLYLKLLIFPHPLSFDYSIKQIPIVGIGDYQFLLSAIIFLLLFIYVLIAFRKKHLLSFAILFFLIAISISSNLLMYIGTHMAERLLYVPSFGFSFAAALLLDHVLHSGKKEIPVTVTQFFSARPVFSFVLFFMLLLYSYKTVSQSRIWKNNRTLYESGIISSPLSHRTHYYLGNYLLKKENLAVLSDEEKSKAVNRAFAELRQSADIFPGMSDVWLQMGTYFSNSNQTDSAIFYLKKAIAVQPSLATAHNNLGAVYFALNDLNKAVEALRLAIKYDPLYHDAYKNMGSVIATAGKFNEAIPYFKKAIELDSGDAETYYFLAITYESMGNMKMRKYYMDIAVSLNPQYGR